MISNADDTELNQILQDLYGRTDIPDNVIEIFKQKLGGESLNENWEEDSLYESLLEVDIIWDLKSMITENMRKDKK
jgi:hypothetical protein